MDIIHKLLSLRLGPEEHTIVAEAMDEIERLREALKEIEERTIDKIVVKLARAALKGDE